MERLSQIDFESPDSCYLFPLQFRDGEINFFVHFDQESDNSNSRPLILEFLERVEELANIAHASMPKDDVEFTDYYSAHLHEAGYAVGNELLRKIYGRVDRDSVTREDFHQALKIANVSFITKTQCGVFDFSPDPQEYDQWLAMTVQLNGTPRDLSWES